MVKHTRHYAFGFLDGFVFYNLNINAEFKPHIKQFAVRRRITNMNFIERRLKKMNKKGESKILLYIVLGVIALFALGYIKLPSGATTPVTPVTPQPGTPIPSSGLATVTLNFDDKLATTATPVVAEYYIFNGEDKLAYSGTAASDGSASKDVSYGKSYKLLAFNGTGTQNGYYAVSDTIVADAASVSKNIHMYKEGLVSITVKNPTDLSGNITANAGQTKNFFIELEENKTRAAYQNPIVLLNYNKTGVQEINIVGATVETCPTRTASYSGRIIKCFALPKEFLLSTDGIYQVTSQVTFSSLAQEPLDYINVSVIDKAMYKKPGADKLSDFVYATEDQSNTDVGAKDAPSGASTTPALTTVILQYGG